MSEHNFFPALLDNPRDSEEERELFSNARRVAAYCNLELLREFFEPFRYDCFWKIQVRFPASFSQTTAEIAIRIWLKWLGIGVASRELKYAGAVPRVNWSEYALDPETEHGLSYCIMMSIQSPSDNVLEHLVEAGRNVFGSAIDMTCEPLVGDAAIRECAGNVKDNEAKQVFEMLFLVPDEEEEGAKENCA